MPRVAWLTDIHLDFIDPERFAALVASIRAARIDSVLLTGDVAEAADLAYWLARLDEALQAPLYFVLGNHDYYGGSIREIRRQMDILGTRRPLLCYLTNHGPVHLSDRTALVGHDGWADAREGDYERSMVMMNDYRWIEELKPYTKQQRRDALYALGDEAAAHLTNVLPQALESAPHVVVATHVPPLRAACWHEGRISDDEWAPHFVCQAMGAALLKIAAQYPHREITVLCGHTHSPGLTRPAANLQIITGGAKYGEPRIEQVFDWP